MGSTSEYQILSQTPSPEEYQHLRTVSGLTAPPCSTTTIAAALAHSCFCVVAREAASGKAVGMVRLIGDGHLFLQIVDVAVDPAHQRKGLGASMLRRVLAHVDEHAPTAYVSLMADPPGVGLYSKFGFTEGISRGMKRSTWGA